MGSRDGGRTSCKPYKNYDHRRYRRDYRVRSIKPCIARRSIESGCKPGPHHWVVEHTFA